MGGSPEAFPKNDVSMAILLMFQAKRFSFFLACVAFLGLSRVPSRTLMYLGSGVHIWLVLVVYDHEIQKKQDSRIENMSPGWNRVPSRTLMYPGSGVHMYIVVCVWPHIIFLCCRRSGEVTSGRR